MNYFSGVWHLDDLAVVSFTGPDAATFLHSQLTNKVEDLPFDEAKPAAYCTAQGRILANCFYWRMASDGFAVIISADLMQSFIKRMKMFVLRAKVSIQHLPEYKVTAYSGLDYIPSFLQNLPAWSCYQDQQAYWLKIPSNTTSLHLAWHISKSDNSTNLAANKSAWYAMQLAVGLPMIRAAVQEKFLPSSLNMDLNGFIDFKKGCYPGQEIIARSHYRGTVKRRLAFAVTDCGVTDINPSDLYSANTQKPIARIIDFAIYERQIFIAAEVNLADIENDRFLLQANGPELEIQLI